MHLFSPLASFLMLPLLLVFSNMIIIVIVWFSLWLFHLGFMELLWVYRFHHNWKLLDIISSTIFFCPFLSLLSFWDSNYMYVCLILSHSSLKLLFPFSVSDWIISIIMSSNSLIFSSSVQSAIKIIQ